MFAVQKDIAQVMEYRGQTLTKSWVENLGILTAGFLLILSKFIFMGNSFPDQCFQPICKASSKSISGPDSFGTGSLQKSFSDMENPPVPDSKPQTIMDACRWHLIF